MSNRLRLPIGRGDVFTARIKIGFPRAFSQRPSVRPTGVNAHVSLAFRSVDVETGGDEINHSEVPVLIISGLPVDPGIVH